MITPPPNPKAQQARQEMIAYRDGVKPCQTLTHDQIAQLRAMYPSHFDSAMIEPGGQWCNEDGTSIHIDDPRYITVTLFDKRAAASMSIAPAARARSKACTRRTPSSRCISGMALSPGADSSAT